MTYLLPLVLLNLIAIGFYMHARVRGDLRRVIVFQPGAVILCFLIAAASLLQPDLGEMRIPGLIYGLVLPFVFWRAVSTFFGTELRMLQSRFFSLGTLSLYVGDIEFALHTYKRRRSIMYGPILYAGGQLSIALSTLF